MEKKKTSGLFVLVVFELILLVLILISSLYQQGLNKELHAMIEEGKPSSTTETVLPPLPHFYDNCGLFRLGIEAVYRIPLEEADNYSYGYCKEYIYVKVKGVYDIGTIIKAQIDYIDKEVIASVIK